MSKERRCEKHNKILKRTVLKCDKCGGTGEERRLLLFHKECSLCHGTGKLEHFEACEKCKAEQRAKLFPENKTLIELLNRNYGGNEMKCPMCHGTGSQMATKEKLTWGHLSKVSGVGRRNVPISRPCPYCKGTGKKSR